MKTRAKLCFLPQDQDEWVTETKNGYAIKIVVKLERLTSQLQPANLPEGHKFKLVAFNTENPQQEFVRIDNYCGELPHYHLDKKRKLFTWISWEETKKLFYQLACERFGYFDWKCNKQKKID